MDAPWFDLQSHSVYSDGALAPGDVVRHAAAAGVQLLALTDHDSVEGVDEALAAAAEARIGLVSAAELSAVHDASEDLHVLGYGVDHHDPGFAELTAGARAERVTRAAAMGARLRALGFEVDERPLEQRRIAGKAIGRPHLAAAVIADPANGKRLRSEGVDRIETFIPAYLIPGRPGYLPRTHPSIEEAIGWIHCAGGVAVWAHPFWDLDSSEQVLETIDVFRAWGLDGVECFYPTHTAEQTGLLVSHCEPLGLLRTGSADFHGPDHGLFSRFRAFELYGHEPNLGPIATSTSFGSRDHR
jgi:predicted metal-dependent phosphoesterase TrpH